MNPFDILGSLLKGRMGPSAKRLEHTFGNRGFGAPGGMFGGGPGGMPYGGPGGMPPGGPGGMGGGGPGGMPYGGPGGMPPGGPGGMPRGGPGGMGGGGPGGMFGGGPGGMPPGVRGVCPGAVRAEWVVVVPAVCFEGARAGFLTAEQDGGLTVWWGRIERTERGAQWRVLARRHSRVYR